LDHKGGADVIEGHIMPHDNTNADPGYQNSPRKNDVRILTPILMMALIIVAGFIVRGISPPAPQTATASNTAITAQR